MKAFRAYCVLTALLLSVSCSLENREFETEGECVVNFAPDMTSLVRNPLSGWVLYDDANDYVSNAYDYWKAQDTIAEKFASIFYLRSRWSDLEPEEGKYAWEYDENFKALIHGALERGLKLAFCVYVDGQDNICNGTPDFVRQAGADGYPVHRLWDAEGVDNNWTPYADDPVFQEKFSNFVRAFAREFDDPSRVDFVDAFNLGWWGEGHHIKYKDSANKVVVFQWITELYGNSFQKVILVTNFGTEMGWDLEKRYAVDRQGYIIRRNSLGSTWFRDGEVKTVLSVFPQTAFVSECCYWGGYSDEYQPWNTDPLYKDVYKSWQDFYSQAYKDAIRSRANTLDLREVKETQGWTKRALDLVNSFVSNGGYRLSPVRLSYHSSVKSGAAFTIRHTWRNSGVGVCPNNNPRWNYKYKVAFAILDNETKEILELMVDESAEPSIWLNGKDVSYEYEYETALGKGSYSLATAIVDCSSDLFQSGLNLAVDEAVFYNNWLLVGNITIN